MSDPKVFHCDKMWAYFAPDGYIQFRTIAPTKKYSREMLPRWGSHKTYKDYEAAGFVLKKVGVDISIKKQKSK